jgi:hypothetical protein
VKVRRTFGLAAMCLLVIAAALPTLGKDKEAKGDTVDSGSFGVFMNGRRVATETFSIEQNANGSVVSSEFKSEPGMDKADQSSELQLTAKGDLRKYEWKESSPQRVQAEVVPNDDFLSQRTTVSDDKPTEQPYLLPPSTVVLDDYFFVHREVLLWKYLATACRQQKGQLECPVGQRTQYGTLDPHDHSSMPVSVEYVGHEKTTIHGAEQEVSHFVLKTDAGEWSLWLDDHFKLQRIIIASEHTEVVRD